MSHTTPKTTTFLPTVLLLMIIASFATDIYLPSFPSIQASFHTLKHWVQLSLSLYLLGSAFSQLFYGPLSDQIGRKKTAQYGLTFSLIGTLLCLFSPNIVFLIIGRIFQGMGLGAGSALGRAIMRDSYSGDALARFGAFIAIGSAIFTAIAPTIGGYVQHYMGWRINFLLILIFTILGLLLICFRLPETNPSLNPIATKPKVILQTYFHLLKSPIFMGYSLCSSLAFGGLAAYFTSSPFLFQRILRLSPVQYGWLAIVIGAGFGLGGVLNAILIKAFGRHRILVVGIAIVLSSGILMLALGLNGYLNTLVIILPMGLFTFGAAMMFSNSFAGAFQPFGHIAGSAGALYGCIQLLGGSATSTLIATLNEINQIPLALVLISISLCGYICQLVAFSYAVKEKNQ